jgi:RND family efflux transporter MFP subunit
MNKAFAFFKKRKYISAFIILALIAGGYYWYRKAHSTSTKVQYVTAVAEKGTLATSVSASGSIIVEQSASVDPTINGTVANLAVSVGDSVKKGQLLFNIVNDQLGVSLDQAYASYTQAQSSLISAKASEDSADATYKADKKSGSGASHDQKEADKKRVEAAKISVTAAEQSLTTSAASLNYAQQQAAKRNVASPIDGTVNQINVKNGDNLGASSSTHVAPIIVGDLSTLQAQVQVNEVDVSNVKIGQKATLTFDALPDFSDTGSVVKVDSLGTTTQGVVTYNVTISLDTLDSRIKPDMSVTADVVTSIAQDVITVPLSAVKTQSGSSYVEVLNDSTPIRVPVQTGASNDTSIEITSGINPGDKVITQTIGGSGTSTTSASSSSANRNGGSAFRAIGGFGR